MLTLLYLALKIIGFVIIFYILFLSIKGSNYTVRKGKIIFSGLESSGKSLLIIKVIYDTINRNYKFIKKYKLQPRNIYSNIKFSNEIENYAKERNIKIIYWSNLEEIIGLEECDIIVDEIGTYFDAIKWEDLTIDARRWIAQIEKLGVSLYGTSQDFSMVHKSFRRITKKLWHIVNIASSDRPSKSTPPIKKIWGICLTISLNPQKYNEETDKFSINNYLDLFTNFNYFFIRKKECSGYNTQQRIVESKPLPYKHIKRECNICGFNHIKHI